MTEKNTNKTYMNFRVETDEHNIVWIIMDVEDATANVLSSSTLEELDLVLLALEQNPPAGAVFTSGKAAGFIAGADVKEFEDITDREGALKVIQRGQKIMNRIEALGCPTVALINGFCMGGGVELALACDYRIALDEPGTRFSLPEIKLGIHPGYGGTVRSVRVAGPLKAMDLMLTGRSIAAQQARKMGLVDHAVPERVLRNAALRVIKDKPAKRMADWKAKAMNSAVARPLLAAQMRKQVGKRAKKSHYPAPYSLIDVWQQHGGDEREMMRAEAQSAADLSTTDTARNLLRVFLLQDRLKALGDKSLIEPRHVHVVGGGLMGGDIAGWCALQGFTVTVQDPNSASLAAARQRAAQLFARRLRAKPLVTAALDRLIADKDAAGAKRADVIIEAIYENAEAKQNLFRELEPVMKPEAILATNTSSIKLETLAESLKDPGRLVGLHFFNPVRKMPLVEVIHGEQTDAETIARAAAFVRHIDKLPLPVKSSPGFLVNRVLMPYMLEAVIIHSEGVPKRVIDKAATDFGMPMGPVELADTVGLDVGLFVGEILGEAFGFDVPEKLRTLVAQKKLGRKTGEGFYAWKNGKPVQEKDNFSGDTADIAPRLITRFANEATACLRDGVVEDADLADAGIIFGTGFAPFRGGPLHYRQTLGQDKVKNETTRLAGRYGDRFALAE